jgi:hypothetical protein
MHRFHILFYYFTRSFSSDSKISRVVHRVLLTAICGGCHLPTNLLLISFTVLHERIVLNLSDLTDPRDATDDHWLVEHRNLWISNLQMQRTEEENAAALRRIVSHESQPEGRTPTQLDKNSSVIVQFINSF